MTEPMSSREIEDVLSSIRRLVSEDLRPAPRPPAVEGKLLLTPALRVVEPVPPVAEPSAPPSIPAEDASLEDVVARIGAGMPADAGWEADLAEDWAEGAWPGTEVVEVDLDRVDEAEVVQFTPPEQSRLVDAWRDGAWPEGPAAPEAEPPAEPAPADPEPEAGFADRAEAEAVAEILREEEALAARAGTAAQEAVQDLFAPADTDDFGEEALREVVRDLIREELQGALGERITRNVRKLVRAEIARALAARELS